MRLDEIQDLHSAIQHWVDGTGYPETIARLLDMNPVDLLKLFFENGLTDIHGKRTENATFQVTVDTILTYLALLPPRKRHYPLQLPLKL